MIKKHSENNRYICINNTKRQSVKHVTTTQNNAYIYIFILAQQINQPSVCERGNGGNKNIQKQKQTQTHNKNTNQSTTQYKYIYMYNVNQSNTKHNTISKPSTLKHI